MPVPLISLWQRLRKRGCMEVRTDRLGAGADVGHEFDVVGGQKRHKRVQRTGQMPDAPELRRKHDLVVPTRPSRASGRGCSRRPDEAFIPVGKPRGTGPVSRHPDDQATEAARRGDLVLQRGQSAARSARCDDLVHSPEPESALAARSSTA